MEIVDFLLKYWKIIALAVVVLLEIILLIFKGKTKTVYFSNVSELCDYIREAETLGFDNGGEKLLYVLEKYFQAHPDSEVQSWFIKNQVERILSTPTKKGGSGREED